MSGNLQYTRRSSINGALNNDSYISHNLEFDLKEFLVDFCIINNERLILKEYDKILRDLYKARRVLAKFHYNLVNLQNVPKEIMRRINVGMVSIS